MPRMEVAATGHRDALASTLGVPLVHVVFPQFMLDFIRMSPVEVVDMIGRRLCNNAASVEGFNGGLTRTMTSNLLELLKSCVLSVLRGKGPHAALDTPPGREQYSSTLPVLTLRW